jgi:hypothetical protein
MFVYQEAPRQVERVASVPTAKLRSAQMKAGSLKVSVCNTPVLETTLQVRSTPGVVALGGHGMRGSTPIHAMFYYTHPTKFQPRATEIVKIVGASTGPGTGTNVIGVMVQRSLLTLKVPPASALSVQISFVGMKSLL